MSAQKVLCKVSKLTSPSTSLQLSLRSCPTTACNLHPEIPSHWRSLVMNLKLLTGRALGWGGVGRVDVENGLEKKR